MWKADRKSSFDQGEQKEALDRFLAHTGVIFSCLFSWHIIIVQIANGSVAANDEAFMLFLWCISGC
jgi:hypothetical protein